jgi:HAD superfamily hydrolase (TIGR01509 family)
MMDFPKPNRRYAGYIFDCDGTLADSMPIHLQAWNHGLESADAPLRIDGNDLMKVAGMDVYQTVEHWNDIHKMEIQAKTTVEEKTRYFLENRAKVKALQPVVDFARECYKSGATLSVASGGTREDVEFTIACIGIRDLFTAVVTADDVQRSKPFPDLFLLAAKQMGIKPEDCLVIEDSPLGIEAANRAGMHSILIPPTV